MKVGNNPKTMGMWPPIFRLGVSQDVDGFIDQFIDQVVGLFSQTGSIPRQVAPMDDGWVYGRYNFEYVMSIDW